MNRGSVREGKDWARRALCRGTADLMFSDTAGQRRTRQLCTGCPVLNDCLAEALDHQIEFGVWGGMTEKDRRVLLRRRPNVTSWRAVLCG